MKSFETTIKPLLKYGDGVAKETGKKFKEFGCTKVLAGYDANLPESVVSTVLDSITAEGIELIPYSCPYADGQDTGVLEVRQLAIDHQVDGFLAMGGGSTMDIVKAATLLVDQPLPIDQYFVGWYNGPDLPRKAHLISIPTTSGTGAEATRSCIIASQTLGVKATLSSQAAKADFVYLDPQITKSLPPYVTATTGMDAIAHACEALCCTKSNLFTEMICGKSLELSWANLLTAYKEPDNLEARANMSMAAYLGLTGESYGNCGHSMAHAIGARFHVPHGHCCAWTAPVALYFTRKECDHEIRLIARCFGMDDRSETVAADVANAMKKLVWEMNIATPAERGISREEALDGVRSITVRVGTLSGVIPHFLTDCWVAVTDGTEYDGVPLRVETEAGRARCLDCGAEFEADVNDLTCPGCGGKKLMPLTGRDMTLQEIEAV